MDIILRPFAWLLLMLYKLVNNYGIALFLFAILVKIILFPFALKGKKGMIKMNMLNGKVQKLQKMYSNNQARYNEEVQKLYQEEGVNPMGGCLWSMIPLFILLPLYSVIRQPMKYMMGLGAEQISKIAEVLNWSQHSIDMGWVKNVTDAAGNLYAGGTYNELYLASMINEGNLAAVQAAAGEGANVLAMNFNFLGMDLSQIPTWKFWSNGADWTTIGLFLLVIVSAVSGIISSKVTMKTNSMNSEMSAQAAQTNRTMMLMMPVMSILIGFSMPGLLNVYWVANNILAMAQEIISGRILKKDYEEAAKAAAENAIRTKEEEKQRKRELAEKRAREAEEAKKNKKKAAEAKAAEEKGDSSYISVSRVGIRAYARGRAYDPERFGGVTPYHDPDGRGKELEAAGEEAEEKAKEAEEIVEELPAEVTAAPAEQVEEAAAPASEEAAEEAVEPRAEDAGAEE